MLLPPQRRAGERVPAVVNVYPNTDGQCYSTNLWHFDPYNRQLLAAAGYAVVFANTSAAAGEHESESAPSLTRAVIAAVDAASEAGYIDGTRVGLLGFSQGHHSALQVLTQTGRFKGAAIGYGISNFTSQYGAMPLYMRLGRDAVGVGDAPRFEAPSSDNWLGAKLWEDPERYIRNSPVFDADKVHTPLLILHSDFDAFPLGQTAEIFSALYRLRRRASYVTYWGEGHLNLSPANIRDMWQRLILWYDENLQ